MESPDNVAKAVAACEPISLAAHGGRQHVRRYPLQTTAG
jgi:hypothetical protein